VPLILDDLRRRSVPSAERAKLVLSTAHKAKGLEFAISSWIRCSIGRIFSTIAQCKKMSREQIENLNSPYVSATRAKPNLNVNEELIEMIKEYQADKARLVADPYAT
jgi:superfamily I DNA/RNA helicase